MEIALSNEKTNLVQTPPLFERSNRAAAFVVIVLNVAITVACPSIISVCTSIAPSGEHAWAPDFSLYGAQWVTPVATL